MTPADWDAMPPTLRVHADWLAAQGLPEPAVRWVVQVEGGREVLLDETTEPGRGKLFKKKADAKAFLESTRRHHQSQVEKWTAWLAKLSVRDSNAKVAGWVANHEAVLAELTTAKIVRVFQFPVRTGA